MNRLIKGAVLLFSAVILASSTSCGSQQQAVSNMLETPDNAAAAPGTALPVSTGVNSGEQADGNGTAATEKIELYPAQVSYLDDGKWGYIDNSGKFAIEPRFSRAEGFQANGLAVAGSNGKLGIIDTKGRYIAEPIYEYISDYSEGLAVASGGKGSIVLDEAGRKLSAEYGFIGSYNNKRAIYRTQAKDGTYIYGYLDQTGKPAIEAVYQNASEFEGGMATVTLPEQKYALIDTSGSVIRNFDYNYVGSVSDGLMEFRSAGNDKYGYIDTNGKIVIQPAFSFAGSFKEGRAVVAISDGSGDSRYGLIDRAGRYVIQPKYSCILQLGENCTAVGVLNDPEDPMSGSSFALADKNGRLLTDFMYKSIQPFRDGIAPANDNKQMYFINTSGKRVETLPCAEGTGQMGKTGDLVFVDLDERQFYMNDKGEVVYKPAASLKLDCGVTVSENKFKPNRDYLVYYPVLSGMADSKAQETLNALLRKQSEDPSEESVKQNDNLDYTYDSSFGVSLQKKDLLALEFGGYYYPKGAAHGMPSREYMHIDLKKGSVYKLKDLFKSGSNYKQVLSDIVSRQIKEKMESDPGNSLYFNDGYSGIAKEQPFYITEDSLVLYFMPYEIAAYAAGFPEFPIKFSEISGILDKEGAFWRSFNNIEAEESLNESDMRNNELAELNIVLPKNWSLDTKNKAIYNFIDDKKESRGWIIFEKKTGNSVFSEWKPNHSVIANEETVDISLGKCRLFTLDADNGTAASGKTGTHKDYYAIISVGDNARYIAEFTKDDNAPQTKEQFMNILKNLSFKKP